jgi:hypothetical protein
LSWAEDVGSLVGDALGRDAFADAVSRVQRRSGEEQLGIACVIFGLLIEAKYGLIEPLSEPVEDFLNCFSTFLLKRLDRDAAGRDALADAVSRVQRRSGEEQEWIACAIFALLDEHQFDIPPPSTKR